MKKTEITLLLFCFLSLTMDYFDITSWNLLPVISWSSLSVYYFFLTINFNEKKINPSLDAINESAKKMSILDLFTCITLSEISIGILFKIEHWPNGGFFLVTGFTSIVLTFILRIVVSRRKSIPLLNRMLIRLFLLGAVGAMILLKPY